VRLLVLAVGRARSGPVRTLWDDYAGRLRLPIELREIDDRRAGSAAERTAREGELMLRALPDGAVLVALDETGRPLTSQGFAAALGRWRDAGVTTVAFALGGADGLAPALLHRAALVLSLGAMTWPHMLARVLLVEQLYRAECILSGHPYHRG